MTEISLQCLIWVSKTVAFDRPLHGAIVQQCNDTFFNKNILWNFSYMLYAFEIQWNLSKMNIE